MVSQKVFDLCQGSKTVSSEIARDPTLSPGQVIKHLYGEDIAGHDELGHFKSHAASPEDLEKAFRCGKWGNTRPSELFLKVYHDALCSLEGDPMAGMTSPPLLGGCGIVPLTIISTIPDICRHMSNCIARAEKEVFLATNYWQSSDASTLITNSLKELSRRAGERGHKAVVKIMYDRGNAKQVLDNHQLVSVDEYTGKNVHLPSPTELPNIDLEVINYHKPVFGTFHSKYMVVDRKIAILQSNNIQDNDNLEMMTHIEGPIVDSFWDMALCSWHKELKPPLSCLNAPAAAAYGPGIQQSSTQQVFVQHGDLGKVAADGGVQSAENEALPEHSSKDSHYDPDIAAEIRRSQSILRPSGSERRVDAITRHLNTTIQPDTKGNAPEFSVEDEMTPYIAHIAHDPVPMALVCRKPWGAPNHQSVHVPQNEAFLSAIRNAQKSVFIQTPNLNAEPLLPALIEAVRRCVDVTYYVCLGYNDAGELLPFQGGINEMISHKLYGQLNDQEKQHLNVYNYVGKDQTQPIHNKFKKRSCHIKVLIVDAHLAIQGNGNQDTQTWYHSQEINVMLDSPSICAQWIRALDRNQNTHLYGAVRKEDGCWRDEKGEMAEGAIGVDPGKFSWAKGVVGAVQRVRGAGGF